MPAETTLPITACPLRQALDLYSPALAPGASVGQAGRLGGSLDVFKHFARPGAGFFKMALSSGAPPDRAC